MPAPVRGPPPATGRPPCECLTARAHRNAMTAPLPRNAQAAGREPGRAAAAQSPEWLRLAHLARVLSWLTLAWMAVEGGVAIGAAIASGSVALLGFGLDSGIEAIASIIVIWRFTGARLASPTSERRGAAARRRELLPARPLHRRRGNPRLCEW
jgi:hypothetical protein